MLPDTAATTIADILSKQQREKQGALTIMNTSPKINNNPPWEDWEDHGGFDDDEALIGKRITFQSVPYQKRSWYYEKKSSSPQEPITVSIQMSFL